MRSQTNGHEHCNIGVCTHAAAKRQPPASASFVVVVVVVVQVTQRQLRKELRLPEFANVDRVEHRLGDDGTLVVDIVLANEGPYKCHVTNARPPPTNRHAGQCHVTTQDLSPTSAAAAAVGELDVDEEEEEEVGDDDDCEVERNNDDDCSSTAADVNGFGV